MDEYLKIEQELTLHNKTQKKQFKEKKRINSNRQEYGAFIFYYLGTLYIL